MYLVWYLPERSHKSDHRMSKMGMNEKIEQNEHTIAIANHAGW